MVRARAGHGGGHEEDLAPGEAGAHALLEELDARERRGLRQHHCLPTTELLYTPSLSSDLEQISQSRPYSGLDLSHFQYEYDASCVMHCPSEAAVERTWHIQDSQGQIVALASR